MVGPGEVLFGAVFLLVLGVCMLLAVIAAWVLRV